MYQISDFYSQQLQVIFISVFVTDELWGILGYTVGHISPQSNTEIISLADKAPFPNRESSFSHFHYCWQQDTRTDSLIFCPTLYVLWAQPGVHLDFCGTEHQAGISGELTFWSFFMLLWRRWQFLYDCLWGKNLI